jgi:hypothetical protein
MAEENKGTGADKGSPLNEFLTHQRKAAEETFKALDALIPPDFRTHGRAAKEEFLTSFKVLIEGTAEAIEQELNRMRSTRPESGSGGDGPSTTGKSKVKVEVS